MLRAVRARAARPRASVLVLAYHVIADLPEGSPLRPFGIPPEELTRQLDLLRRTGHEFVDLDTLLAALDGTGATPRRAVLVTFDDCTADLRAVAAPLLAARRIPAVAFAVAGALGDTNRWDADAGQEPLRLLDAEELRGLAGLGVEVGGHSLTHARLPDVAADRLDAEISGCREQLEAAGLPAPRAFAYPYGAHDAAVVDAARDAGYQAAFTTESGVVTADSDRFRLPRLDLRRGDTGPRLLLRIAAARARGLARQPSTTAAEVREPALRRRTSTAWRRRRSP
jgi:peptidoglycan/xylan/chitin deacetylase (PgdA/CDA1 family)